MQGHYLNCFDFEMINFNNEIKNWSPQSTD
jgi:hypothetical protein